MKNKATRTFSIWLMPQGNAWTQLSSVIQIFAEKYGGPLFEPHFTLVGGFTGRKQNIFKKTNVLSLIIQPFNVIFDKVNYLDEFFRSFFLEVKFTDELKYARKHAQKLFNCHEKDYLPHMSLSYGNYDLSTKLKMSSEIGKIPDGFFGDKIFLVFNNEIDLHWEIIDCFELKR